MAAIRLKVWGELACFTRPEAHVEQVSYPVMTPSAARGILHAIFWRPEFAYRVRSIAVLKPIRYFSIVRNGVKDKINVETVTRWARTGRGNYFSDDTGSSSATRVQLHTLALRDVAYIIDADIVIQPHAVEEIEEYAPEFVWSYQTRYGRKPGREAILHHLHQKYVHQFQRRVSRGQFRRPPCLGLREFAAYFSLPDGTEKPIPVTAPLGSMFFDFKRNHTADGESFPIFFPARLENGILRVPDYLYEEGGGR